MPYEEWYTSLLPCYKDIALQLQSSFSKTVNVASLDNYYYRYLNQFRLFFLRR